MTDGRFPRETEDKGINLGKKEKKKAERYNLCRRNLKMVPLLLSNLGLLNVILILRVCVRNSLQRTALCTAEFSWDVC